MLQPIWWTIHFSHQTSWTELFVLTYIKSNDYSYSWLGIVDVLQVIVWKAISNFPDILDRCYFALGKLSPTLPVHCYVPSSQDVQFRHFTHVLLRYVLIEPYCALFYLISWAIFSLVRFFSLPLIIYKLYLQKNDPQTLSELLHAPTWILLKYF